MQCPHCHAPLEEDATFCGNCGRQVVAVRAPGATISEAKEFTGKPQSANNGNDNPWSFYGAQRPQVQTPPAPDAADRATVLRTPPPPSRNIGRIVVFASIIIVVIAAGTIGLIAFLNKGNGNNATPTRTTNAPPGATATVTFLDSSGRQGHTDALKINATGLSTPGSGLQYDAWLVNDQNEQTVALGKLTASDQGFTLDYGGDGKGTNLLGLGNKFEITLEQGKVSLPTGKVVLSASFPPLAFLHVQHLLFSFPTVPHQRGLLVGLLGQTQLLNAQALALNSAFANGNTLAIQCAAQAVVDIAEGKAGANFQPLPNICRTFNLNGGDNFGLLGKNGYIDTSALHASLAATQADSTDIIKVHARHVNIAMDNIRGWVKTIDQDALSLLNVPNNHQQVSEIVQLSNQSLNGIDINGDESIDPLPGEAGAITAYNHAHLMAALTLNP